MAGIYNGHLLEFPQIRVDCFTNPPPSTKEPWILPSTPSSSSSSGSNHQDSLPSCSYRQAPNAQLFLLSHAHSDHLFGLTDSFTGHIICTPDTKAMLLRLEAEMDRQHLVDGVRERGKRKYEGLKAKVVDRGTKTERVIDRIEAVTYGVPREFDLGFEDGKEIKASIVLLDANHCPGSAMFLIKSADKAVLHTGDIRADRLFLQSLRRNPAVQEFIGPCSDGDRTQDGVLRGGRRILDRIYVDTGAVLGTGDMPDKEPVLRDLLEQMSLYPPDTIFFLNVWCFGWEDIVKEVARHFNALVHVDRYKRSIYSAVRSDPFLKACTTLDPNASRFHACERRAKCVACRTFDRTTGKRVWNTNKRIVHVNMVEVKTAAWAIQHQAFLEALRRAATREDPWPYNIDCPIARHSPLPELQALVKLFRPKSLSPNTMINEARGLDYFLLPSLFSDCLAPGDIDALLRERDEWFSRNPKFGPAYVEGLKKMQQAGVDLLPSLDAGSEPDEHLPEVISTKLGAGRRANAEDQLARAGGLPRVSMAELTAMIPAGGQQVSQLLSVVNDVKPPLAFPTVKWYQYSIEEHDTDEEDDVGRKRRRRLAPVPVQVKVETKTKDTVTIESPKHEREGWTTTILDGFREVKVELNDVKLEDVKPIISRGMYRRPRFAVDKEHLRTLSRVSQDVDDL